MGAYVYVDCLLDEDQRFHGKFRRRFRMPFNQFTIFVEEVKRENYFPWWMGGDATGRQSSPIELLLLGALRYLGHGFTFDDLEECTAILDEVHRVFFHKFIEVGSTHSYNKFVKAPQNSDELHEHMHEFIQAEMPGAFASMNAIHIIHEICNWRVRRAHMGPKLKHATRTYNLMVKHRRQILTSTQEYPGLINDKTVILFDIFMQDIKNGKFDRYTFSLFERRRDDLVEVQYNGVWITVDNGYHNWSITVPPVPNSDSRTEIRWSEWVKSMRKDAGEYIYCFNH